MSNPPGDVRPCSLADLAIVRVGRQSYRLAVLINRTASCPMYIKLLHLREAETMAEPQPIRGTYDGAFAARSLFASGRYLATGADKNTYKILAVPSR